MQAYMMNDPATAFPKPRRTQQRSTDTRRAIIDAALAVFAERGFDGASTRAISERAVVPQPLLVYHFKTKDELWRAVACSIFELVDGDRERYARPDRIGDALDRVREEFRLLFRSTLARPKLHQFMLREAVPGNPRLVWLVEQHLKPYFDHILPDIAEAQAAKHLPGNDPSLLYYMLIGMTTALTALSAEIEAATGRSHRDTGTADGYWSMIDQAMFGSCRPFGQS